MNLIWLFRLSACCGNFFFLNVYGEVVLLSTSLFYFLIFLKICTTNHVFKRKIWDKFTEFTFWKYSNLQSETKEISKFQKMNEVNFPEISRIDILFLLNHMWKVLKEHTRVKLHKIQSININKVNKKNSITPTLQ